MVVNFLNLCLSTSLSLYSASSLKNLKPRKMVSTADIMIPAEIIRERPCPAPTDIPVSPPADSVRPSNTEEASPPSPISESCQPAGFRAIHSLSSKLVQEAITSDLMEMQLGKGGWSSDYQLVNWLRCWAFLVERYMATRRAWPKPRYQQLMV